MPVLEQDGGLVFRDESQFYDVDLTDGTWTLTDTQSTVKSLTIDSDGYHTLTFNAVGASNEMNTITTISTDLEFPIWRKTAEYNGTTLSTPNDIVHMTVLMNVDQTVATANRSVSQAVFLGLTVASSSTNTDTMDTIAAMNEALGPPNLNTGSSGGGMYIDGGFVTGQGNTLYYEGSFHFLTTGGSIQGAAGGHVFDIPSKVSVATVGQNRGQFSIADNNLHLICGVGAINSSTAFDDGDQIRFKLKYILFKV